MNADIRCKQITNQPQHLSDHVWLNIELHNMSKTEGIAELYFETKKVDWESARINISDNISINGYFCRLYENDDEEEYELSEMEIQENRCDVCNLIKEMNNGIDKSTRKKIQLAGDQ